MKSESFIVPALSIPDIEKKAFQLRCDTFSENTLYYNVMDIVEHVLFNGLDMFDLQFGTIDEMGNAEGYTAPDGSFIKLRNDVYVGACAGNPRDRFTVAHELGHFWLHTNIPMARIPAGVNVKAYQLSEWQANQFAASLLMPEHLILPTDTIQDLQSKFGVSYSAAELRLNKIRPKSGNSGRF